MRIVLIGPRGSGKSTVAGLLTKKTSRALVSTDEKVVEKAGMPIGNFVAHHGWEAFRDLEQQAIEELAGQDEIILDCGGGAVEREANRRMLVQNSFLVYLTGSAKVLTSRISGDSNRPALTNKSDPVAEMERILEKRAPLYRLLATIELDTDNKGPEELAKQIATEIGNRQKKQ